MEAPEQKKKTESVQEKPLESLEKKPEQVKPEIQVKPKPHAAEKKQQSLVSANPKPLTSQTANIPSPSNMVPKTMPQQTMKPPYGASVGSNPMFSPSGFNPAFTGSSHAPYGASVGSNSMFSPSGANPAFTGASHPPHGANFGPNLQPNVMPHVKGMVKQQALSNTKPVPLPTPVESADIPDHNPYRYYEPFIGPFDPCPPMKVKRYVVPINQYINFQPKNLPQFSPAEALHRGTLWPKLFSPYEPR